MDPLLLVVVGVLGYVVLGLVTARGMWRLDHTTVAGPRDTTAVVIAWPLVLVFIAAAFAAGSATSW